MVEGGVEEGEGGDEALGLLAVGEAVHDDGGDFGDGGARLLGASEERGSDLAAELVAADEQFEGSGEALRWGVKSHADELEAFDEEAALAASVLALGELDGVDDALVAEGGDGVQRSLRGGWGVQYRAPGAGSQLTGRARPLW